MYKVSVEHTGLVVLELVKIDLLAHYEKRASLWKWMEMRYENAIKDQSECDAERSG